MINDRGKPTGRDDRDARLRSVIDIVEAESGRDALRERSWKRSTFAIILMDVHMPTLNGYETAKLIRGRPAVRVDADHLRHRPLANEDVADPRPRIPNGAVDFVFTPIVPNVLRAKVSVGVDRFVQTEQLHRKSEELQRSLASITSLNQALSDSQASTQAVLDNVADGILTTDQVGRDRIDQSVSPNPLRVPRRRGDRSNRSPL